MNGVEIDLRTPPSDDVACLASVIADLARWLCEVEERLVRLEASARASRVP